MDAFDTAGSGQPLLQALIDACADPAYGAAVIVGFVGVRIGRHPQASRRGAVGARHPDLRAGSRSDYATRAE